MEESAVNVMHALGRIEGKLDGIHSTISDHGARLTKVEEKQANTDKNHAVLVAKASTIATLCASSASFLVSLFKHQ